MSKMALSQIVRKRMIDEMNMWDTFGTLISSGVPILQAIDITRDSFPRFRSEMQVVHDDIKEGEMITSALNKYPDSFHPLIYPMICVGEETGALPDMLLKGRDVIESDLANGIDLRSQQKSSVLEKYAFLHCSATLVDAGLPLVKGLNVLAKIPYLSGMKETIVAMREDIESGFTFSETMASKGQNYFDKIDVNMIRAGEAGGVLDVTMMRLADYTRRRDIIKR